MSHAERARKTFKRVYGPGAPTDLINAGKATLADWLRILDAERERAEVAFTTTCQDAKRGGGISLHAASVLAQLEAHTCTLDYLETAAGIALGTLNKTLQRLLDEALIARDTRATYGLTDRGVLHLAYIREHHAQALERAA